MLSFKLAEFVAIFVAPEFTFAGTDRFVAVAQEGNKNQNLNLEPDMTRVFLRSYFILEFTSSPGETRARAEVHFAQPSVA